MQMTTGMTMEEKQIFYKSEQYKNMIVEKIDLIEKGKSLNTPLLREFYDACIKEWEVSHCYFAMKPIEQVDWIFHEMIRYTIASFQSHDLPKMHLPTIKGGNKNEDEK